MSVQNHLEGTASNLVLSPTEKDSIERSISTLKSRLNHYFGSNIKEQVKFGSSTRGTILPRKADASSDIDYMIVFDNTGNYKPQTFIDRLKRFAQNQYASSEIHQSHPTVVLSLNHIKFDLVPAYKTGIIYETIYIPGPVSGYTEWISTDPNSFNSQLTDKNNSYRYLIKPTIRLVKYWNAQNIYVYNSYELEKELVSKSYWPGFIQNQKTFFYEAIGSLSTWSLPQYKVDKVQRAKSIIEKTQEYEKDDKPVSAENEIKKLIPAIY